jgi:uncharacterized protein DUF4388
LGIPLLPSDPLGGDDLIVRGELETTSVAELFRSLMGSRETGILTLRNGEITKSVYIQKGRVVYAASTNPDERLGESLLVLGKITARQYLEASRLIRPGRRLGAILVELGALEPDDLIPSVEQHAREILMDLFDWVHGEYELNMKDMDPDNVITLNISTENLLLEGIRRCRAWSQVARGIGGIDTIYLPTGNTEVLYKLELSAEEQEVLSHVNGRSTIEHICNVSYLSNFETCRVLWALEVLGVVKRAQGAEAQAAGDGAREHQRILDLEGIVETFNSMFGRIYGFLQGRIGGGVDEFMDTALDEVGRQYGALFEGVDLKQYGRADYEQMLANIADLPADQRKAIMVSGLNELVYVMQLQVRTRYGKQEEAVVSGLIKEGLRRLSGS